MIPRMKEDQKDIYYTNKEDEEDVHHRLCHYQPRRADGDRVSISAVFQSSSHHQTVQHVAEYIKNRDGGIESDWEKIILCAGASEVA